MTERALRALGQAILASPRVEGDIERAKAILDVDGSGNLSPYEVQQGLRRLQLDWREFFPEVKSITRLFKRLDLNQDGHVGTDELLGLFLSDTGRLEDIEESPTSPSAGDVASREVAELLDVALPARVAELKAALRTHGKRLLELRKERARLLDMLREQTHPSAALRSPVLRAVAEEALDLKRQNLSLRTRQLRSQQALKGAGRLLESARGGGAPGGGAVRPALAMSLLGAAETRTRTDPEAEVWLRFQEHVQSLQQGKALQEQRQAEETGKLKAECERWRVRILEAKRQIAEKEREARANAAYLYSLRRALEHRQAGGLGGAESAGDGGSAQSAESAGDLSPQRGWPPIREEATPRRHGGGSAQAATPRLPALTPR